MTRKDSGVKRNKNTVILAVLWIIAIGLMIYTFWFLQENAPDRTAGTELRFIDVGNADSCLITAETGESILIDAGNPGDHTLIQSHMNLRGVHDLDMIFVSHFHMDHMGGLLDLLEDPSVAIGKIYYPGYSEADGNRDKVMERAEKRGIEMIPLRAGDVVEAGDLTFSVLLPKNIISMDEAFTGEDEENNRSMVIRLVYGNTSALFMGDLEKEGEKFLQFEEDLKSDIVKVGHHGSHTSSSADFLEQVQPRFAVVPTGRNSYGHPAREVLVRLQEAGAKVLRSDQCGTLRFILSEDGIEDVIAEKRVE